LTTARQKKAIETWRAVVELEKLLIKTYSAEDMDIQRTYVTEARLEQATRKLEDHGKQSGGAAVQDINHRPRL
jgi:hypothetical protein